MVVLEKKTRKKEDKKALVGQRKRQSPKVNEKANANLKTHMRSVSFIKMYILYIIDSIRIKLSENI